MIMDSSVFAKDLPLQILVGLRRRHLRITSDLGPGHLRHLRCLREMPKPTTYQELFKKRTGIEALDSTIPFNEYFLGFPSRLDTIMLPGRLIELISAPAVVKTRVGIAISIEMLKLGGTVIYATNSNLSKHDLFVKDAHGKYACDKFLAKLYIAQVRSSTDLIQLRSIIKFVNRNTENVSLLVLDNVTRFSNDRGNISRMNIHKFSEDMKKLANTIKFPIVSMNNLTTNSMTNGRIVNSPRLGALYSHKVDSRVLIRKIIQSEGLMGEYSKI